MVEGAQDPSGPLRGHLWKSLLHMDLALATEVVFKTARVTEKKVLSEIIGGHEPEGPETKRFKSLTTETEEIQHAVCSLRGGGFQRLRLMPPT